MSQNPEMDAFMQQFPRTGLTFDDVSLVTRYADFLPDQATINSRLTTRIKLNVPFVSAAMDTVTEAEMAIAMAMLGGIGVIHKNLPPEAQAKQVSTVKHHLNGMIEDPVAFRSSCTLDHVRAERESQGFTFSGFPILDDQDHVVGILTSSDIKFARDGTERVADVMTTNIVTAPSV